MAHQHVRTNVTQKDGTMEAPLTISTTAVGFTAARIPNGCTVVHCTLLPTTAGLLAPARYRYDGTAPTNTVGHKIVGPIEFDVEGENDIRNFKIIRDTTSTEDVLLTVTFEVEA